MRGPISMMVRRLSTKRIEYTHGHAAPVVSSHALRTAEEYASHVTPKLRFGDKLLDVGCGPGSITKGFRKYVGPGGRVVGVDLEPNVLVEAKRAVGEDAEILQADAYALPFAEGEFDVAHAHQVLQHVADPVGVLREMRRVARRNGGIVAVREVDYESWFWHPAEPRMDRWKDVYRAVCRRNGADPDAGRKLAAWFAQAGFERDAVSFSGHVCLYTRDRAAAWAETWAKRTAETKLADQAISYGLASRAEIDDMARGWRAWGAHPDATLFYVDVAAVARCS